MLPVPAGLVDSGPLGQYDLLPTYLTTVTDAAMKKQLGFNVDIAAASKFLTIAKGFTEH